MPERKPYAPPPTVEKTPVSRDPYAAFRYRGFVLFTLGNFVSIAGRQMLTIAIEWEVYARTHSATALGLVGLVAAVPIVALSLPAGHISSDQILHCGPIGLGWLRAAPAIGAFAMAVVIAYLPPMRQAGRTLLGCVTGFGVATIVFGASRWFWLSLLMLFLTGVFDSVSVVVRQTLVQLLTPDEMRGRVSAVNNIFIGTSNEFGALESGLTAAIFGPVVSVIAGGIGTILIVLAVAMKWPETRRIGALDKHLA